MKLWIEQVISFIFEIMSVPLPFTPSEPSHPEFGVFKFRFLALSPWTSVYQ